jgi:hypothetical protein
MPFRVKLHYDNNPGFRRPYLWAWYEGSSIQDDFEPTGEDPFGFAYDCSVRRQEFRFKFKEGSGTAGPGKIVVWIASTARSRDTTTTSLPARRG